jgi:antitoxin CptB
MLEMDILLGEFLETEFPALPPDEQAIFAELADLDDITLWPWVSGQQACEDTQLARLIVRLRRHVLAHGDEQPEGALPSNS